MTYALILCTQLIALLLTLAIILVGLTSIEKKRKEMPLLHQACACFCHKSEQKPVRLG